MKTALRWTATISLVLLVWQAVCVLLSIPRYVFPRPTEVFDYAVANATLLAVDSVVTGIEALAGLTIGIVVSLLSVIFVYFVPHAERLFAMSTAAAQSIPVLVAAPFLTFWFGSGVGSKTAAAALVCVFPLIGGWIAGKNSISPNEQIFADSVLPTRWARLWHFILPRSLPGFVVALKVAAPLSVLGALVGEFVGARQGLGFRILTGSYYLRTEEMVSGVFLACAISLLFYLAAHFVEKRWLFWHGASAK